LNLIGSIHDSNFEELEEIAVFDLGLEPDQIKTLQSIQKVSVHPIEKTHPDLTSYYRDHGIVVFGWYAWKPVAITQALKRFPYVLWLDAGTIVFNNLDHVFQYIKNNHYLLCTIGDQKDGNGRWLHPVRWGATSRQKALFNLDSPERQWILDEEIVMGGVIGVAREGQSFFLSDLYEWTKDLANYADDGSAPNGWGAGRHDQILISGLSYTRNLVINKQDGGFGDPIPLLIDGQVHPFYITWAKSLVNNKTEVFNCRVDKSYHSYYFSKIRYKSMSTK